MEGGRRGWARVMAGRGGSARVYGRGRRRGPVAGIRRRRKIGRRRRRGDGQTAVPGSGAAVRGRGIRRDGRRVGRRAQIGRRQALQGRIHGAVPGRRTVNAPGPGVGGDHR